MDFSMIKKIFQKPRFFQDQGYFLQAKIFHPCNTSDLRQKYFKTFLRILVSELLDKCRFRILKDEEIPRKFIKCM